MEYKKNLNPEEHGGAPILGVNGLVLKVMEILTQRQ